MYYTLSGFRHSLVLVDDVIKGVYVIDKREHSCDLTSPARLLKLSLNYQVGCPRHLSSCSAPVQPLHITAGVRSLRVLVHVAELPSPLCYVIGE
jgi:hypothetical protein